MADDAGALLVRSGLVSSSALDEARARVASIGGTLGEQLVVAGAVDDDELTEFYRSRLLVPQVDPNMLARLTPKVVAAIPADLAIELRAIPVSLDGDNNLTVAMSDPSDRHGVDEIGFFTGAYVVRAVATQMQIAWCLAHYYGHITALGQRLLRVAQSESPVAAIAAAPRQPRAKGLTGKVNATRHRAVAPVTGPVDVLRPSSGQLDLRPRETSSGVAGGSGQAVQPLASAALAVVPARDDRAGADAKLGEPAIRASAGRGFGVAGAGPGDPRASAPPLTVPGVIRPNPLISANLAAAAAAAAAARGRAANDEANDEDDASPTIPVRAAPLVEPSHRPTRPGVVAGQSSAAHAAGMPADGLRPPAAARPSPTPPPDGPPATAARASAAPAPAAARPAPTPPPGAAAARPAHVPAAGPDTPTLVPGAVTARGGVTAPAEAIDDESSAPTASSPDMPADVNGSAAPEKPRARSVSGEIRVPVRRAPSIRPLLPTPDLEDDDEPLIMIEMREEDDETGPRPLPLRRRPIVKSDPPELYARAGEVDLKAGDDRAIDVDEPRIVVDEDALAPETGRIDTRGKDQRPTAPITMIDVVDDADTGTVIHDRVVDREPQPILPDQRDDDDDDDDDSDTGEIDIVVLDAPKKPRPEPRPERRTQLGVGPVPAGTRPSREIDAAAASVMDGARSAELLGDATSVDVRPAPPGDDTGSDQLAAPPAPASDADTNPHVVAAPPAAAPAAAASPATAPPAARSGSIRQAVIVDDEDDDEDGDGAPRGSETSEMTAAELDDAIPERASEAPSAQLLRRRLEYDLVDDGWGPPGTTIPPPLLGAIPGSEDYDESANAIPMSNIDSSPLIVAPPSAGEPSGRDLVRALEDATARAIDVIRQLEHTRSRDEVIAVMITHLAETHHRAGFFVTKHTVSRDAGELGLFAMMPQPPVMPAATLRLDRPSTLQDVVGTRMPYRGPMHDDASRAFLVSVLGACPPEILLVPVTVRERVVGVLFGEHRQRQTFDDQVALAARAAGMALERILRARRG